MSRIINLVETLIRESGDPKASQEKAIKDLIMRVNTLTDMVEDLQYKLIYANIK